MRDREGVTFNHSSVERPVPGVFALSVLITFKKSDRIMVNNTQMCSG
jgi:hypothetical protein